MNRLDQVIFKSPPSEYSVAPFWFLNHDLTTEETIWQVQEMHRKGVAGAILHPRNGLITPYMSEEFLGQIQAAVEECERLGMKAYLYDEDNFTSGSACGEVVKGHPEYRMSQLFLTEEFQVGTKGIERALSEPPLAVVAVPKGKEGFPRTSLNLMSFVKGRTLRWKPEDGKWNVYVFARRYATGHYHGWWPDLLNEKAMKRFIELTHRRYAERVGRHFGTTVPGIFTDEPAMNYHREDENGIAWTDVMAEEFSRRHGYDLIAALPALFRDLGEQTVKVRCDFYDTATELYVRAFFKQIYDYCDPLRLATMGHVLYEGELQEQAWMQGDFFRLSKFLHYGGLDQLCELTWWVHGEGLNNVLGGKFASSAAHLLEKPVVMSECFGLAGQWAISLRTLKWLADWQVLMGANLLQPHCFYYSIQGFRKWECPPGEFYQSAFWPYYRLFADYCARLCYLFREGRHVADAALLYPIRSMWAGLSSGRSADTRRLEESFNQISRALLRANCDYDILPEETLETAEFAEGKVIARNEAGKELEEYQVLVLPELTVLKAETVPALVKYLESGGKILVGGELPKALWGKEKEGCPVGTMREALVKAGDRVAFLNPRANWDYDGWEENTREKICGLIELDAQVMAEGEPVGDIIHLHHLRDGNHLFFFSNTSRTTSYRAQITVRATGIPKLWDPMTGDAGSFERFEAIDGKTVLHLDFEPTQSHVMSLEPEVTGKQALAFEGDMELLEGVTLDRVFGATRKTGVIKGILRTGEGEKEVLARQPAAPLKPFVLPKRWNFRTEKPNALPLGDWQYKMAAEVSSRDHATDRHTYTCRFNCAVKPKQARILADGLAGEKAWSWEGSAPANAKFFLNGQQFGNFGKGEYLDHFILEADVSALLRRGENVFIVRTQGELHESPNLAHPPILVGEFSLGRAEEGDWIIRAPKATMRAGDWSEQGYPFYSGIGVYSQEVELPASFMGKRLILELEAVGDLAEVVINGRRVAVLAWEPFKADVTNHLRRGRNKITLKVANSMQNLLCQQPKPSGILGEVRIVTYNRVTLK